VAHRKSSQKVHNAPFSNARLVGIWVQTGGWRSCMLVVWARVVLPQSCGGQWDGQRTSCDRVACVQSVLERVKRCRTAAILRITACPRRDILRPAHVQAIAARHAHHLTETVRARPPLGRRSLRTTTHNLARTRRAPTRRLHVAALGAAPQQRNPHTQHNERSRAPRVPLQPPHYQLPLPVLLSRLRPQPATATHNMPRQSATRLPRVAASRIARASLRMLCIWWYATTSTGSGSERSAAACAVEDPVGE
jgi:hypothetical protein